MNRAGAMSGMVCGIALTAGYILWFKFLHPELSTPDHWWFGISPEGIGALGMLVNFTVAGLVYRFAAPPSPEVQKMVDDIRVPLRNSD